MTDILNRMTRRDMTQAQMVLELQKKGLVVQPSNLSTILRGLWVGPKATRVMEVCEEILDELDGRTNGESGPGNM